MPYNLNAMENETTNGQAVLESPVQPGRWGDLALYIFGGFGLFLAASVAAALVFPELTVTVTLVAILINFIFIGGAALVFGIRRGRLSWAEMGLSPARWKPEYLLLVIVGTFVLLPIRALLGLAVQLLVEGNLDSLMARQDMILPADISLPGFLALLVGVGLLVPVAEELYFRGLLQGWLRQRLGLWGTVLVSAIVFGLAHFDSIGVVVSAMIMGVLMGWAYERTRSLWVTIGMHALTNTTAMLLGGLGLLLEKWLLG